MPNLHCPEWIRKHSGLRHVTLHNVVVGITAALKTFKTTLLIMKSEMIPSLKMWISFGRRAKHLGNGVEATVLNETGGREVLINDKLSAHQAYILALYRHRLN